MAALDCFIASKRIDVHAWDRHSGLSQALDAPPSVPEGAGSDLAQAFRERNLLAGSAPE